MNIETTIKAETTIKSTEKEQWTAPEIKLIGINDGTLGRPGNVSVDGLTSGS